MFRIFFGAKKRKTKIIKQPDRRYLNNKEEARKLVLSRLEYYNRYYNYKWNRVSVKNTKRRWGSCSARKNLNFCYKVVFLPPELADYVVVHELCHLGQFNHSTEFWKLVSHTLPEYKLLRKRLLQLGSSPFKSPAHKQEN